MGAPSTSRTACTWTWCCRNSLCPTMWTWGWCFHRSSQDSFSWTIMASLSAMSTSMRLCWMCAKSIWLPRSSWFWRRSWPRQGPSTCWLSLWPVTTPWPQVPACWMWTCCSPAKAPPQSLLAWLAMKLSSRAWCYDPFNFAHMDLNMACLVEDGRPLPTQPWWLDFELSTNTEAYHVLMKSNGIYPSDWGNDMTAEQFVGGSILLSWDLTLGNSDGMAYLSLRQLGTMKANLRITRLLPTIAVIIAYMQHNNLLVINKYRTVALDYNTWCSAGSFRRPWWGIPGLPGPWWASTLPAVVAHQMVAPPPAF